nr:hypothetical protein Q903MT_gene4788 [Picea sitchensis]
MPLSVVLLRDTHRRLSYNSKLHTLFCIQRIAMSGETSNTSGSSMIRYVFDIRQCV